MSNLTFVTKFIELDKLFQNMNVTYLSIQNRLSDAKQIFEKQKMELSNEYSKSKESNDEYIKRVNALIKIAYQRANIKVKADYAEPYDNLELTKLAIQMDSSPDPNLANTLYTRATAQRNFLEAVANKMLNDYNQRLKKAELSYNSTISNLSEEKNIFEQKVRNFVLSNGVARYVNAVQEFYNFFVDNETVDFEPPFLSLGLVDCRVSLNQAFSQYLQQAFGKFYYVNTHAVKLPYCWDIQTGGVIYIDYTNSYEDYVFRFIQTVILNTIKYYSDGFDDIVFIDPIRMNDSALGIISPLTSGTTPLVRKVPDTFEKIQSIISNIVKEASKQNVFSENKKKLLVFHNFLSYGSSTCNFIRQLCINAKLYGYTIIVTNNTETSDYSGKEVLTYIKNSSLNISMKNAPFILGSNSRFEIFDVPDILPSKISELNNTPQNNSQSNSYDERVGLTCHYKRKGNRQIVNIPYGIDETGKLLKLNFNNELFATFICGAARSGKTNLLHVLITGIITHFHPDDVEIWLIDLNKVGFSRYMEHTPPHLKYLILDESPELIFDLIDKLNDIMRKRQYALLGKWDKTTEIPEGIYMPEMFIIIDEFSVLSQIIQNSSDLTNVNYKEKFQNLLTLGAKVGMHFIFANQTYSSGISGLSETARKQINQRIAMYCPDMIEIKDTLSIKNASDYDITAMERLSVYHTLIKKPADEFGNHITQSKVLCIYNGEEENKLYKMIDDMNSDMEKTDICFSDLKNDPYHRFPHYHDNLHQYVLRKPPVKLDGNTFVAFGSLAKQFREQINHLTSDDVILLLVGQPKRLVSSLPLEIINTYNQNVLVISSYGKENISASLIVSMMKSLHLQAAEKFVFSNSNDKILHIADSVCGPYYKKYQSLDSVCTQIKQIKSDIETNKKSNSFYFLFGMDTFMEEMSYIENKTNSSYENSSVNIEPLGEGELSIMERISRGDSIDFSDSHNDKNVVETVNEEISEEAYDARSDLKYILKYGPKSGYHFVVLFNSPDEFRQTKWSTEQFFHKILFGMTRSDASEFVGSGQAMIISKLTDYDFRYSGGLKSSTFRPLLHRGISWNGWTVNERGEVILEENFDYID